MDNYWRTPFEIWKLNMAIRSRLKSALKKALFGAPATKSDATPPPGPPASTFTAPNVSTKATDESTKEQSKDSAEKIERTESEANVTPIQKPITPEITTETLVEVNEEPEEIFEEPEPSDEDEDKASFTIEITDLFPSECPKCGDSTYNNWVRLESRFACESCGEVFE